MNILEINNVVKQYANHRALDEVSLDIPDGKIYGLLGPNGAGKTTLIRIINGITAPDSGEVLFNGTKLSPAHIAQIGYLPEERGLYKKMKVGEQALYLARLKGLSKNNAKKALKKWFEKFQIETWWDKKVEELSKGMAQKVQFITTILHQPKLLIFDEPFSGFDPVNTELIKQEILELNKNGASIIFSTHNMASVEELCENISLINRSKIVLQGNVAEIRNSMATNKFSIKTKDKISLPTFNKLSETASYQSYHTIIELDRAKSVHPITTNEILEQLIAQTTVYAFEEMLPSMNDIFIQKVNE